MSGVPLRRLGDYLLPIGKWNPDNSDPEHTFTYIDISAIDQQVKEIREPQVIPVKDAPSRARQIVRANDVLVSTVRPNLNAVASVPGNLDGVIASTGFTVLRPKNESLDHRYLHQWVRSKDFVAYLVSRATGASYPAVSDGIVKDARIPLPNIDEQRRIAAILDKADAIRRKRQQALALADDFLRSSFLEMFGDPIRNPKGWPVLPLGQVAIKITDGEHINPEFHEEGVPMVMAANVLSSGVSFDGVKYVCARDAEKFRRKCKPEVGDILMVSRGATIGRCCLVTDEGEFCLMGSVILIKPDNKSLLPKFLSTLLMMSGFQRKLYKTSGSSAQQAIYLSHLKDVAVPVPPMSLQLEFSGICSVVTGALEGLDFARAKSEYLFASLSHRAFRGEL